MSSGHRGQSTARDSDDESPGMDLWQEVDEPASEGFRAATTSEGPDADPVVRDEVRWTTIALAITETLIFVAMLLGAIFAGPAPPPAIIFILFFGLRAVADIARWIGRGRPLPVGLEGHLKAIAWGMLALLALGAIGAGEDSGPPPAWAWAGAAATTGLALYGHHRRAFDAHPALGTEEGILGAFMAALGLAFAIGGAIPNPTTSLVVGGIILAVGLTLALTISVRLTRSMRGTKQLARTGFGAFYHEHFFRHTFVLAAAAAWFFLRETVRGIIPLAVVFEYAAGVSILGIILWSMRDYMSKRLAPHPLASPHTRHDQKVERQGEPGFDDIDTAFGTYLGSGEVAPVRALAAFLEPRGVPKTAFRAILEDTKPPAILLVHPAWLYGARALIMLGMALAVVLFASALPQADAEVAALGDTIAFIIIGVGLFLSQWNAFGGPSWAKAATGWVGAGALLMADLSAGRVAGGTGPLLAGSLPWYVGAAALALLVGLPAIHIARRGKSSKARYAALDDEPGRLIDTLRREAERNLVLRVVWLSIIGLILFIVLAEMERFFPGIAILFSVYVVLAAAIVAHPVLLVAGLRIGRAQAARLEGRQRRRREEGYQLTMKRVAAHLESRPVPVDDLGSAARPMAPVARSEALSKAEPAESPP